MFALYVGGLVFLHDPFRCIRKNAAPVSLILESSNDGLNFLTLGKGKIKPWINDGSSDDFSTYWQNQTVGNQAHEPQID